MSSEDGGDALMSTLATNEDALPTVIANLEFAQQCRVAAVSRAWQNASALCLAGQRSLDLHPFRSSLSDGTLGLLLSRCPSLAVLNLSECAGITDDGISRLPSCCPRLRDLNLSLQPSVTADGVSTVVDKLPELTSLELAGCRSITEAQLVARFARFLELDDDEDGLGKVQG